MALRIESNAEPIPGYRLLERLGAGGYGEVWKAEAPGGLLKAIKIVRGDGPSKGARGGLADQELKALRRVQSIRHPYLLSIDRYDVIDGHLLIVTELADGSLWDRWLLCRRAGDAGLPRESLLRYFSEAAEVLDLMHTKHRLQHLDIKPQNLFLIHDHVKVADFGLVTDLQGVHGILTGGVTPLYAAPETFNDAVSPHCDQYSLAIAYCELLTGHRPFAGGSARLAMLQHLQAKPNLDSLPECDRPAVARALAKSPAERFASCVDFVRALGRTTAPQEATLTREQFAADDDVDLEPAADTEVNGPSTETAGDPRATPTLVIGLGGVGGTILQRLRASLIQRQCDLARLRLIYVDTDGDALTDAQAGEAGLSAAEELHVSLQRPAYYQKPGRDGRLATDGWLHPHILNRLARQQSTQGIRALGRLAFVDHERSLTHGIAERIRPLAASSKSRRTKVIVVAGLAGGAGSGMFLDIAALAQRVLQRHGGSPADVHGWLLVPPVRKNSPAEVRAMANACAALRELVWTSRPILNPLTAERDVPKGRAPFAALTVLPMDSEGPSGPMNGIEVAVNGLIRELTESWTAERPDGDSISHSSNYLTFRTMGAVQYSWPRNAILDRAAIRVSHALIHQSLRAELPTCEMRWMPGSPNNGRRSGLAPKNCRSDYKKS
jgi:hypothetical protein